LEGVIVTFYARKVRVVSWREFLFNDGDISQNWEDFLV